MKILQNPAALASACRARFFALNPDVDVVITDDPAHIGYLCGYRSILHDSGAYPQALIASRDGIMLITGASDAAAAVEMLGDPSVIHRHGLFFVGGTGDLPDYADMPPAKETYAATLKPLLATLGQGRIALDLRGREIAGLAEATLLQSRCISAADAFRKSRAVKLPGELDVLRHASRITSRAVADVAAMMEPGVTELEISAEINRQLVLGGGISRFVVVTSGERSSRVDAYASNRALAEGDLVRLDIGASVNGYQADMARTYAVGTPSAIAADRYDAILAGELLQLDMIKPGAIAGDIFDAAIARVRQGALPDYSRNHCGHGIGLRAHEFPNIGPKSETPLAVGMVLCVETPYYEIGWGGMMVEDTVIVTETGYEHLTDIPNTLRPLDILAGQ